MTHLSLVLARTALLAACVAAPLFSQSFAVFENANRTAGDNVGVPLFNEKATAITKDGSVFVCGRFIATSGPSDMRIYRSTDGGATFKLETAAPATNLNVHLSMVTGADGYTLHATWMGQLTSGVYSVLYGQYDTLTKQWLGTSPFYQVLWQGGSTSSTGYIYPDIDLKPDGHPVVCCTTSSGRSYLGLWRDFDGNAWTPETRINVDSYGVYVNVQVDRAGDLHFAYRTSTGSYGIRYRRWDAATAAWGTEGEVQVWAGTATTALLAVDGKGHKYVVYVRTGGVWLAEAAAGVYTWNHHQVNADTGVSLGNNIYYHIALAMAGDRPMIFYSYKDRSYDEVFVRFFVSGTLTPELSVSKQPNRTYTHLASGRRHRAPSGVGLVFTSEDVPATTKNLVAYVLGSGYVPLGTGCAGSGGFIPEGTTVGVPTLGNAAFALQLDRALGGTVAVMLLGFRDDMLGSLPLPLDLTGAGMPGCFLRTDLVLMLGAPTSGSGPGQGQGSLALPIPGDSRLSGARLFSQWLVFDKVNALGLVASSAGASVLR